jgi:riboflavin kinase
LSTLQDNEQIHLPDLHFSKFCEKEYEINRGVYNTIDHWFYEQGIRQIVDRRNIILQFFQYICIIDDKKSRKIKFGPGGLTSKLNKFWLEKSE